MGTYGNFPRAGSNTYYGPHVGRCFGKAALVKCHQSNLRGKNADKKAYDIHTSIPDGKGSPLGCTLLCFRTR